MFYIGDLEGFPEEVVNRMLECQVEHGNIKDLAAFEKCGYAPATDGGFNWGETEEGDLFWQSVISNRKFSVFHERYPQKTDMNAETYYKHLTGNKILIDSKEDAERLVKFIDNNPLFSLCTEVRKMINGGRWDRWRYIVLSHRDDRLRFSGSGYSSNISLPYFIKKVTQLQGEFSTPVNLEKQTTINNRKDGSIQKVSEPYLSKREGEIRRGVGLTGTTEQIRVGNRYRNHEARSICG